MARMRKNEPTQRTEQDYEIPVPKRRDFMNDLRQVAQQKHDDDESDARGAEDER